MLKTCRKCGVDKPLELFPKQKQNKDGRHSHCKTCRSQYDTTRYDSKKRSELYFKDVETERQKRRDYYMRNKGAYYVRRAHQRAGLLYRIPKWLTDEDHLKINCIYSICKMLNKYGNERYEVDHIVPLRGKTVWGLHVPSNLRILPQRLNRSKGNKHDVNID